VLEAQYHEITLGNVTIALCVLVSVTYVSGQFHVSATKKGNPGNRWIGCWVDPRVVLEAAVGRGKISALLDKTAAFKHAVSLSLIDPFQPIQ
jgi:hypothetical protein